MTPSEPLLEPRRTRLPDQTRREGMKPVYAAIRANRKKARRNPNNIRSSFTKGR